MATLLVRVRGGSAECLGSGKGVARVTVAQQRTVQVGDEAPDFALTAADGRTVRLSDYRGKSEVVLFFYPKDYSPACTAEACSFRDRYEEFQAEGAQVIGISGDSTASHQRFQNHFRLPYELLSDPGGTVRARFGVPRTLGVFPGRTTYLIDREGMVRHLFNSQLNPFGHVSETLRALKSLRDEAGRPAGSTG